MARMSLYKLQSTRLHDLHKHSDIFNMFGKVNGKYFLKGAPLWDMLPCSVTESHQLFGWKPFSSAT